MAFLKRLYIFTQVYKNFKRKCYRENMHIKKIKKKGFAMCEALLSVKTKMYVFFLFFSASLKKQRSIKHLISGGMSLG